jgi:hypothetical protein
LLPQVQLLDEYGAEIDGCTWKIQRKKLTEEFLQVGYTTAAL